MGEQHYPLEFVPQSPYLNWMLDHLNGWQFGEQGLIAAIRDAIGCDGDCVEYGAGDGESLPLTIDEMYQCGQKCWLVEIDERKRTQLKQKYPLAIVVQALNWKACSDACKEGLSVVVIDIDGSDSVVMREMLQAGVRPALLVVEHFDRNYPIATSFPDPIPQWMLGIKTESGHTIQDTAETLHAIAGKFGYERIGFNRCNSFFVRRELLATLFRKGET